MIILLEKAIERKKQSYYNILQNFVTVWCIAKFQINYMSTGAQISITIETTEHLNREMKY